MLNLVWTLNNFPIALCYSSVAYTTCFTLYKISRNVNLCIFYSEKVKFCHLLCNISAQLPTLKTHWMNKRQPIYIMICVSINTNIWKVWNIVFLFPYVSEDTICYVFSSWMNNNLKICLFKPNLKFGYLINYLLIHPSSHNIRVNWIVLFFSRLNISETKRTNILDR